MLAQRKTGDSSAYGTTMYAELGDKDQAFEWLNTSYQERNTELMVLETDASFDPIRSDPRFAELVRNVGLPQASIRNKCLENWKLQVLARMREIADLMGE